MELVLNRLILTEDFTKGDLKVMKDGHPIELLKTIELPWKNNQRRISCIPAGRYFCKIHTSPKFGWTLWLQDVPNRSAILIHSANHTRQLLGCIAPGLEHEDIDKDGIIDVKHSKAAMKILQDRIKKDLWITITNPFFDLDPKTEHRV